MPVAADRNLRAEEIREGDQAGGHRYGVTRYSLRVPGAVEGFMVVEHGTEPDRIGHPEGLQPVHPIGRMSPDDLFLLLVQRGGLGIQDVHQGRHGDIARQGGSDEGDPFLAGHVQDLADQFTEDRHVHGVLDGVAARRPHQEGAQDGIRILCAGPLKGAAGADDLRREIFFGPPGG